MELQAESTENLTIQAYSDGKVTINGQEYTNSLIISATAVNTWDGSTEALIASQASIVILGLGDSPAFLDSKLQASLQQQGIGVEGMTNAAACRTYNVLVSEERNVILALTL